MPVLLDVHSHISHRDIGMLMKNIPDVCEGNILGTSVEPSFILMIAVGSLHPEKGPLRRWGRECSSRCELILSGGSTRIFGITSKKNEILSNRNGGILSMK